jgi:hypothetical protein
VAVAALIVLVRVAPRTRDEESARIRHNIEVVCAHLRGDLAGRLPRLEPVGRDLPSAAVWAYFFACLATLLLAIVVTR